ncbi:4-hydroxyphenylacetate 3-hydroxylase family protein [uncultured Acetatifactor sp.]|jgi:4-hydroxybutyryl-CoA dehydratase/vinylacetyl-CoA-Delta-isomerase|uniref:4-hydroxyphenylacetate 3-hydroxylase family protein n=2 Tax=uncultured Acetatifactor sp. TaxID=1671927 RepID=UPI00262F4C5E|nr:4-hydroxyphenylacetate 3-hydroxylase N-terminal domain-containing protein [uncultured Acetatifactor sp.]
MALMTGEEYIDSIKKLNMQIYLLGKKINNPVGNPILAPSLNAVKMTYDLAQDVEYRSLLTAVSHLTGHVINRFTHIHQSREDLIRKVKMQRLLGQKTASCFQRCVGMDALNAVFTITFQIDQKYGTDYHTRFLRYLQNCQEQDLVVDGAMTDPKGSRHLPPDRQSNPDAYLRVTERRPDGIVVCGAKCHQTGACNSHELLVMPTISLNMNCRDYAVSFSVPVNTPGIVMIIGRQSCDTRKQEAAPMDTGTPAFGGVEALVIFDHVFVPNDRIFMNGETEFAAPLVEHFAGYHRQSYGGCKTGVGDVLIGAAALAAEQNGISASSHIRDKLVEMTHLNETMYSCGIACSCEGCRTVAGNYFPDLLLANVCKQNVTRFPFEIARLAQDIAGGLMVTAPSQKDMANPETSAYIQKYLAGTDCVSAQKRLQLLRLIENLTLGTAAVGYLTESLHGAGSPQAQRIVIEKQSGLERKKELAKDIAAIQTEKCREEDL